MAGFRWCFCSARKFEEFESVGDWVPQRGRLINAGREDAASFDLLAVRVLKYLGVNSEQT